MHTSTSYRRPATSGGDSSSWFHQPNLRLDSSSGKGRPNLTLKTHRSRSRNHMSFDSHANPRSRSLSPPPSSIVSAAPTIVPSAFSTLPDSQPSRSSFSLTVDPVHVSPHDDQAHFTSPHRLKEPVSEKHRMSLSNGFNATVVHPIPSSLSNLIPNGEESGRFRESKSSLGFHSENTRSIRPPTTKHYQLAVKDGRKLHTNNLEKAPYPLSYDKSVLSLECLNNRLVQYLRRGSSSFIEYSSNPSSSSDLPRPPERCLDLGCGLGTWIIDAAKEWTNCSFVGFDLISNQVPPYLLDEDIAPRVEWVHGNFLTTKLPFEDEEFDHIHIQGVAKGVPENKWPYLFEEINRVLSPGGAIEMLDEDVIFPVSRSFLSALRPAQSRHSPVVERRRPLDAGTGSSPKQLSPDPKHDHALLESLYMGVFDRRFINAKPTAMLPSYFTTYFRRVGMSPVLNFSMPPLPPPKPRAPIATVNCAVIDAFALGSPVSITASLSERTESQADHGSSYNLSRTFSGQSSDSSTGMSEILNSERARSSSDASMRSIAQMMASSSDIPPVPPLPGASFISQKEESSEDATLCDDDEPPVFHPYSLEVDDMSSDMFNHLFDRGLLNSLHPRALCIHLHHAYASVLACQDAMWEELKHRLLNRPDELCEQYGWQMEKEDSDSPFTVYRERFDGLLQQFREDMEKRSAFWAEECEDLGWDYPAQDVLSKAEEMEDTRFRKAMDKIRKDAIRGLPPLDGPCRSIRVLVGFKG